MCQVTGSPVARQHMIGLSPSVLVNGLLLWMKGDATTQFLFVARWSVHLLNFLYHRCQNIEPNILFCFPKGYRDSCWQLWQDWKLNTLSLLYCSNIYECRNSELFNGCVLETKMRRNLVRTIGLCHSLLCSWYIRQINLNLTICVWICMHLFWAQEPMCSLHWTVWAHCIQDRPFSPLPGDPNKQGIKRVTNKMDNR